MMHDYFSFLTTEFTYSVLHPFYKAWVWHVHCLCQSVKVNIELRISLLETFIIKDSVLLFALGIIVWNDKFLVPLILLANFPCRSIQLPAKCFKHTHLHYEGKRCTFFGHVYCKWIVVVKSSDFCIVLCKNIFRLHWGHISTRLRPPNVLTVNLSDFHCVVLCEFLLYHSWVKR